MSYSPRNYIVLYARIYYSRHSAVHIANFRNPDTRPGIIDVRVGRRCQVYLYFVCSINCKHTHITVYIILFKIRYNYLIPTCVPCGILKFERCGGEGTNFTTPLLQRGIIIEPEILFTAPACAVYKCILYTKATHIFRRRARRVDSWWNGQNQKILYNYNRLGMRGGFGNSILRSLQMKRKNFAKNQTGYPGIRMKLTTVSTLQHQHPHTGLRRLMNTSGLTRIFNYDKYTIDILSLHYNIVQNQLVIYLNRRDLDNVLTLELLFNLYYIVIAITRCCSEANRFIYFLFVVRIWTTGSLSDSCFSRFGVRFILTQHRGYSGVSYAVSSL
ncbi:hypothetical protein QTP88_017796 [Uroleucon formosanum]